MPYKWRLILLALVIGLSSCQSQSGEPITTLPKVNNPTLMYTPTHSGVYPGPVEPADSTPIPGMEQPESGYPGPVEQPVHGSPVETSAAYPGLQEMPPQTVIYIPVENPVYGPQAGDNQLSRVDVMIEMADSSLLIMESFPLQAVIHLSGHLPNPCYHPRLVVHPPDPDYNLRVEVYALADPGQICTEVLEPFEIQASLGSFAGAEFKVWINDQFLGEING